MRFTCEKCGWWADVNGVCVCGYSGRPTTRHDSCAAWKTSIVTNADHIRAMTDEELAKFITSGYYQPHCPVGSCPVVEDCEDCWLRWLKKEVEE